MILLVAYLFMVFQSQNLVSAEDVLDWERHVIVRQLAFPWYKNAEPIKSAEIDINSPSGRCYTIKCNAYQDKDTKVDVFTVNDVFIDTLTIAYIRTDPCGESFLRNYIIPQDYEGDQMKIQYLWAGRSPNCVERTYTVEKSALMSIVTRSSYPRVDCPATVTEFVNDFPDGLMAGGIVNVAPVGMTNVMDHNAHVVTRGKPTSVEFPTSDLKGKVFRLICREDTLKSEDSETKRFTILTGSIVHEEFDDIVLEKFKLKSCSVNNINVNRKIINNVNHFKVVFKNIEGDCYEREYEFSEIRHLYYFDRYTIQKLSPRKVACPKKFSGDIDINASRPLYKMVYRILLRKHDPYAVEVAP